MSLFLLRWVIFSEKLTDISCPGFLVFLFVFWYFLAVINKNGWKCLIEWSFFPEMACFFLFLICIMYIWLLSASWVLFLKRKLSIALCEFMLRKLYNNFLRAWHDFVLSLQTLELVQTKSDMSSHSVRFSSAGVLNLSNNKYKANYFDWKN